MFSGHRIDRILDRVIESVKKRDFSTAAELLLQGQKINENDPYLQMYLGIVDFHTQKFDSALQYLLKADEQLKVDAVPMIYAGRIYMEKKEFSRAEECFCKAVEKDRLHPDAHYYAGLNLIRQNRIDEATAEFETVLAEKKEFALARILALLEWKNIHE